MEDQTLAILMAAGFLGLLFLGVPVAISLLISGFAFGYLGFGMLLFNLLPLRIYGVVSNYTLMAVPLFVFMGVMLERSRLAEDLLDIIGHAFGGLPGGMGISIVVVGVLMGASTGIVGATVVTLGLLTLPVFLRRNYNKALACGVICSSGTLGQIIPPSLVLILLADILAESVGTIFAAAMVPGLILATIYFLYVLLVGALRPDWAPPIPQEERDALSRRQFVTEFHLPRNRAVAAAGDRRVAPHLVLRPKWRLPSERASCARAAILVLNAPKPSQAAISSTRAGQDLGIKYSPARRRVQAGCRDAGGIPE